MYILQMKFFYLKCTKKKNIRRNQSAHSEESEQFYSSALIFRLIILAAQTPNTNHNRPKPNVNDNNHKLL